MHQRANLLKLFFIFLLVAIGSQPAFAQSKGYIILGDSIYKDGYINFKESAPNEVFFQETKKSQPVYYTARQLSGIGFENGNRYRSLELSFKGETQFIFLRELAKGTLNLYFLRADDAVYLLKNAALTRLDKSNYKQELQPYMLACPKISWQFSRVRLSKPSLIAFGKSVNTGSCTPLPTRSLGITTAANVSSLTLSDDAYSGNYFGDFTMVSENLSAGAYIEEIMWVKGNLNYIGQLTYQKMNYSQSNFGKTYDQQVEMNLELLRFSLQPKYSKHLNRVSLFAEFGPEALLILQQPSLLTQSFRRNTQTTTEVKLTYKNNFMDLPTFNVGMAAGGGAKYYYTNKHYLSLGLSMSHTFGNHHSFNNFAATLRVNL